MSESVASKRDPEHMLPVEVPTRDPAYTAEVGWTRSLPGYWFAVYDQDHRPLGQGGVEPLLTGYDLVAATEGVIDWDRVPEETLRALRDAPWVEQAYEEDGHPAASRILRALGSVA
jgi:hypothetical protein